MNSLHKLTGSTQPCSSRAILVGDCWMCVMCILVQYVSTSLCDAWVCCNVFGLGTCVIKIEFFITWKGKIYCWYSIASARLIQRGRERQSRLDSTWNKAHGQLLIRSQRKHNAAVDCLCLSSSTEHEEVATRAQHMDWNGNGRVKSKMQLIIVRWLKWSGWKWEAVDRRWTWNMKSNVMATRLEKSIVELLLLHKICLKKHFFAFRERRPWAELSRLSILFIFDSQALKQRARTWLWLLRWDFRRMDAEAKPWPECRTE